jgi:gluconate 2-dehydrogenase gamma chain
MDRRKSLKLIAAGAIATPIALASCKTDDKKIPQGDPAKFTIDRNPDELKYENELLVKEKFFTDHELATITILADIIIPKDDISGSASDAKVPGFIEFIVKDMPSHQTPMRGGLRWLDMQCLKRHERSFRDCSKEQQIALVDEIAYPEITYKDDKGKEIKKGKIKPGMQQGVSFFSLMRNLTATGFYTSEIGIKDIGYAGNVVNQWNGVPADVLKQYDLAYTDKELKECVSFDSK